MKKSEEKGTSLMSLEGKCATLGIRDHQESKEWEYEKNKQTMSIS